MIEFDIKTIERLKNPKVKTDDKLFLFARYIEEKNGFELQPYYWENKFELMELKERIYYKVWLWMNYIEFENLVRPIPEFEYVFGVDKVHKLKAYLDRQTESDNLEEFYTLSGEGGTILFKWAIKELETNYNIA